MERRRDGGKDEEVTERGRGRERGRYEERREMVRGRRKEGREGWKEGERY